MSALLAALLQVKGALAEPPASPLGPPRRILSTLPGVGEAAKAIQGNRQSAVRLPTI